MLIQQDSLNSSRSEATARMCAPASWPAGTQVMQPLALPCQQRQQLHTTAPANDFQQPRLTKAVLDQHEQAALTSLLLMQQQSTPMKAPAGPCAPATGLEEMQTSQPSCETSDTASETGSSSHPPPRKAARRCLNTLKGMATPHPQRMVEPKQPAPAYFPVTRQQDFPMSRRTARAMVQNLLQHPNASTPIPAHLASLRHEREVLEPYEGRSHRLLEPFTGAPCLALPGTRPHRQGNALPSEEAPAMWSVQVWPAPPNCAMG